MELDWSLLRTVLAVADHGSLSGAARHLGQSQPTLGRHVKSAEQALACTLFALANLGAVGSFVFYDAMLVDVAEPKDYDALSTSGYALGYLD